MKGYKLLLLILLLPVLLSSYKPSKEITLTAIGDSFTYLNDHLNESNDRVTKGWITRVKEQVPGLTYINQGHNYWTTVEIAAKIEKFDLQPSDVYTIFLGTNDWANGIRLGTLEDYTNNTGTGTVNGAFRVIINKLRSLNPQAHIILITPMQRGDFVYIINPRVNGSGSYKDKNGQSLESFANAIKAIGKTEQLEVVDLYHEPRLALRLAVKYKRLRDPVTYEYKEYPYPEYINIPFSESDEYPYPIGAVDVTYDGIHPSDKGSTIIANMVVKVIKSIQF
jgi:lysophospholipase L1-like esterase